MDRRDKRFARWTRLGFFGLMLPVFSVAANYFYDNAGRLVKVDYGAAGVAVYTYDPAGNLITRQVQPALTTGGNSPAITSVSNAESGNATIAPNTWVAIYGTNLAPAGDSRAWQAADFVNNQLPVQLDNVSVTVNGKSAFVYYISPTQVNILTPPDPMQGQVNVQLSNAGATSAPFAVQAQATSLAFFVLGDNKHVTAVHLDASLVGPTTLYPGLSTPASPGETILLFANGFGPVSIPVTSASLAQSGRLPTLPVIKIGGIAASVQFAGVISPGLYQFNVVVPLNLTNGDNVIVATYAGLATQTGDLVTVQN